MIEGKMKAGFVLAIGFGLFCLSCSSSGAESTGDLCIPGQSIECSCSTGAKGAQLCNENGNSLGSCLCKGRGGGDDGGSSGDSSQDDDGGAAGDPTSAGGPTGRGETVDGGTEGSNTDGTGTTDGHPGADSGTGESTGDGTSEGQPDGGGDPGGQPGDDSKGSDEGGSASDGPGADDGGGPGADNGTVPDVGACTNADDIKSVEDGTLFELLMDCNFKCENKDGYVDCLAQCLTQVVSLECGTCFGEWFGCHEWTCNCVEFHAPVCVACVDEQCTPALTTCSGVVLDGDNTPKE
jgi:hypothetical protein